MQFLLKIWGVFPIPPRVRWAIVSLFVPKFAVGVVGVVFNAQNEILLFHHTYRGKRFPWGLPGGWLDPREDPAQGIVREMHEETGLTAEVVRPLLIENAVLFRRLDLMYLCKITAGDFRPSSEVDSIQYFSRETLPAMLHTQRASILRLFDLPRL